MWFKIWLTFIYLFLIICCQNSTAQEIGGGNIKMIIDNIEFIDNDVESTISGYAMAYVTFKDSLTLEPENVSIQMVRMRELEEVLEHRKIDFTFVFTTVRKNCMNNDERILLEKYLPKVDSISMNSRYEFINEKGYARRMAIGIPFKIKPGIRQCGK